MWEFPKAQCKNNNTHAGLPVFENIEYFTILPSNAQHVYKAQSTLSVTDHNHV